MGTHHTILQGEHLSQLAERYGFASADTIWNHAENADLKKRRETPNVLLPGDVLFIPPKQTKEENAPTDKRHRFKAKRSKLYLRLVLEQQYHAPLAGTKCELLIDGERFEVTTDSKGRIEQRIPLGARSARLTVIEGDSPLRDVPLAIAIGNLDPVSEPSGQAARLRNLGYYAGNIDAIDAHLLNSACQEFQRQHALKVDGICGAATQAKLKEIHGS